MSAVVRMRVQGKGARLRGGGGRAGRQSQGKGHATKILDAHQLLTVFKCARFLMGTVALYRVCSTGLR